MALLRTRNLVVEKVGLRTRQPFCLLRNINIEIEENKITCLMGESGAGKTIFARTLSALLPERVVMTKGTIYYGDQPVDYDGLKKMRGSHIFYAPQNAAACLNPCIKIKRQIRETSKIPYNQLMEILENLNFPAGEAERILGAYPFQLSGGENQRCLLAVAMTRNPQLLILDEPTASLDQQLQESFMELIKKVQQQYGFTILLITHNLSIVRGTANYIYIILKGEIVDEGMPGDLFSSPAHDYTKEIVNYFNEA
ncbi:MAG: ATP-binding cassette domain-containing protein [Candidatus Aminicenantes bacterium]|nr:ATP-binding cassette domain-containing protein [Candidatus Aminicenantes bacterium]NIN21438.1 ATP-binding cassette domain-containing protein [Candidatus Aminicenantes bacterium]NIN47853.1 ATP-binding cassette domain-containing protein [Candidatus Aminicenantes bacterium]NIN90791.1 ATP-binding cassette domain-containing protein [Candidatus Aminicenantes bacterium]NIO84405.1 ATP-binding cassette domain-containing protein [Candidatus Aminicenantes bacterium]